MFIFNVYGGKYGTMGAASGLSLISILLEFWIGFSPWPEPSVGVISPMVFKFLNFFFERISPRRTKLGRYFFKMLGSSFIMAKATVRRAYSIFKFFSSGVISQHFLGYFLCSLNKTSSALPTYPGCRFALIPFLLGCGLFSYKNFFKFSLVFVYVSKSSTTFVLLFLNNLLSICLV